MKAKGSNFKATMNQKEHCEKVKKAVEKCEKEHKRQEELLANHPDIFTKIFTHLKRFPRL